MGATERKRLDGPTGHPAGKEQREDVTEDPKVIKVGAVGEAVEQGSQN